MATIASALRSLSVYPAPRKTSSVSSWASHDCLATRYAPGLTILVSMILVSIGLPVFLCFCLVTQPSAPGLGAPSRRQTRIPNVDGLLAMAAATCAVVVLAPRDAQ